MAEEQFTEVAPWYDELMAAVPYHDWVRYVEELVEYFGHHAGKVLDLACGTGRVSSILAERGYSVVGVDASQPMIHQAQSKDIEGDVRFYCQRMQDLHLGRRFDLVICLFDSINYMTDPSDLQLTFSRVHDHLQPGGLFIFDINTEAAFEMDLFSQSNLSLSRNIQYNWRAHYNRSTRICEVDMRFLVKECGRRREFRERHVQRCYTLDEITLALQRAGLHCLACLEAYTMRTARKQSDRVYFVVRKDEAEKT
jgi:2-polyprenyl-3-methyl-5-hydroxy-6-metoxy-1,4-benzoquinol methylase